MHESIMQWSSDQLYQGRLQADTSVQHHLLKDLPNVQDTEETSIPLLLIDTTGCDVTELDVEDEVSKGNEGEADIVSTHVTALINAGLDTRDIAVIAPYNLQVCVEIFQPVMDVEGFLEGLRQGKGWKEETKANCREKEKSRRRKNEIKKKGRKQVQK